jgi:hypothetical protein
MHLITSLESKLFDMEFMMGKVVLEQIFWDLSISPAHYRFYQILNSTSIFFLFSFFGGDWGCDTRRWDGKIWSLTLKVEHWMSVFEKSVLRTVYHMEFHHLHSSSNTTSQSNRYCCQIYNSEYTGLLLYPATIGCHFPSSHLVYQHNHSVNCPHGSTLAAGSEKW